MTEVSTLSELCLSYTSHVDSRVLLKMKILLFVWYPLDYWLAAKLKIFFNVWAFYSISSYLSKSITLWARPLLSAMSIIIQFKYYGSTHCCPPDCYFINSMMFWHALMNNIWFFVMFWLLCKGWLNITHVVLMSFKYVDKNSKFCDPC